MSDKFEDFKGILPNFVDSEKIFKTYKILHTAEHIFSQAVLALWPGQINRALAHISENKFANDSMWDRKFSEEDFKKVEEKMIEIIHQNLEVRRVNISVEDAKELFKDNKYKLDTIDHLSQGNKSLTVYWTGDQFVDLCKGPHVENTREIGVVKLLSIAGAYWKANEKNEMLTRVYGTAFSTPKELRSYINQLEKAKKCDHRKLAKEQDLIVFSELIGAGLPMYTPRGAVLRNAVYDYSRELNESIGYREVKTPNFNRAELFKVSGHYDKYKDDMLQVKSKYSKEEMFFKPMNCPQHTQLFDSRQRSYKDLPQRYADFSNLARDEKPGELNGILRSRIFTQDDGHAFLREDQIEQEFKNVHKVIQKALKTYGLEYTVELSLRDMSHKDKYLGNEEVWEKSESKLREFLIKSKESFKEVYGGAAIYGPKMDFIAQDALGRKWQISTIQLDMNMPKRFGLKYKDKDSTFKMPVMIHRAIIGSERFIGIIIEHFGAKFPAWLSPEQVRIIPISNDNLNYAKSIENTLKELNIRVSIDGDTDRMQSKIKYAQSFNIPYMIIIGKKEEEQNVISLRYRNGRQVNNMLLIEFKNKLQQNIQERHLNIDLQ